eukprot:scaffold170016_cov36-Prasinocladus_malaysianus.AAC.2
MTKLGSALGWLSFSMSLHMPFESTGIGLRPGADCQARKPDQPQPPCLRKRHRPRPASHRPPKESHLPSPSALRLVNRLGPRGAGSLLRPHVAEPEPGAGRLRQR